jgi:hypothetical protein
MKIISIETDEFRQPIVNAIASGIKVVIWHQIPASGGFQEWFLIQDLETFNKIIRRGHIGSAFTAYEWIEVKALRLVDQAWLEYMSIALEQEQHNLMLLISPVAQENNELIQLTWVGELEDIQGYYEEHAGSKVIVGRIPSISFGEIVRGYFQDEDGEPKSGPY